MLITDHMKKLILGTLLLVLWICCNVFCAPPRFEKISDHCYYLSIKDGWNVGVVVTDEGILMVNPPQEWDRMMVADALNRISSKPVRWMIFTDPRYLHATGARYYADQGAQLLSGVRCRSLSVKTADIDFKDIAKPGPREGSVKEPPSLPWIVFDHQIHLFPSNIEIRLVALQHNAHTGGDVVVLVLSEKVLFAGDLFEAASYPDIDVDLEGSALDWIDGLKQVIDAIPVLKSAIPQAKPEAKSKPKPKTEPEKTLEEGITISSSHGSASNLQNMKDVLDAAQKLRNDISKAIKAGRSCSKFLASPAADPYRSYANFEPFATLLFEDLTEE
jgi:glyoxylase-like metal-dependent hydrolase (beta-lactamase superfamily II)